MRKLRQTKPRQFEARPLINGEDFPLCLRRHLVASANPKSVKSASFDDDVAKALLASLSLSFSEKCRVVDGSLSSFQRTKLLEVWSEEELKFSEVLQDHPEDIVVLVASSVFTGFRLVSHYGLILDDALEDAYDGLVLAACHAKEPLRLEDCSRWRNLHLT